MGESANLLCRLRPSLVVPPLTSFSALDIIDVGSQCPNGEDALPAKYLIDVERRLVISQAWGALTDDDVREHFQALRADPLFDPTYRQLIDMTGITEDLVAITTKQHESRNQVFAPGVRRAWVASGDYTFGMARMYAVAAEGQGQNIGVFRARREAEEWLGL